MDFTFTSIHGTRSCNFAAHLCGDQGRVRGSPQSSPWASTSDVRRRSLPRTPMEPDQHGSIILLDYQRKFVGGLTIPSLFKECILLFSLWNHERGNSQMDEYEPNVISGPSSSPN